MQTKFIVVGRSGAGKDYLTNYLCEELGLKQLLSYTTRPKRFADESTHIFITDEEAQHIISTQDIIAYTEIGQYKYFGTYQQFIESDIYIVDKQGIDYLKINYAKQLEKDNIQIVVIYVYVPMKLQRERALQRNPNADIFRERYYAENAQFNLLEKTVAFDWFVNNKDGDKAKKIIKAIVKLYI